MWVTPIYPLCCNKICNRFFPYFPRFPLAILLTSWREVPTDFAMALCFMPWPSMVRIRSAFMEVFSKPEEKYASAARSQKRTPLTGHGDGGMSPRPIPMSFTAVSQSDTERAFWIRSNTWGASFSRRRARSSLAEDQDRPIFPERILSSGPASRNLAWLRTFVR